MCKSPLQKLALIIGSFWWLLYEIIRTKLAKGYMMYNSVHFSCYSAFRLLITDLSCSQLV